MSHKTFANQTTLKHQQCSLTLSIVFLNYNRLNETQYTVSHLQQLLAKRSDIEVIAVDNASNDGTAAYLQQQPDIQFISLPTNDGIAGYNAGFAKARGDYIFVLDDDSHPVNEETLNRIICCFNNHPETGIIACRIENMQGQAVRTWHLPTDDAPGESMAFVGCGFAIRRNLFAQIGWYPGDFFLYQNEIEVAIQVMAQGFKIHYDPSCRVIHRQAPAGRANWRRVYYPTRNTIWLIRRYFPYPAAAYLITSRLCMGFIRAIQTREIGWYYRAVQEAFAKPIEPQPLPAGLHKRLTTFWRQNSLFHQLIGWL